MSGLVYDIHLKIEYLKGDEEFCQKDITLSL